MYGCPGEVHKAFSKVSAEEIRAAIRHKLSNVTCLRVVIDFIDGDGELTFSTHIQRLSSRCFYQLRQLRTIHHSLDKEAAKTLVHAFIVTQLEYCNSVLSDLTMILLSLDNSNRSRMLLLV